MAQHSSVSTVTGLVVPLSASERMFYRPPLQAWLWSPLFSLLTGTEMSYTGNK
jgi:hypothetical protein